MTNAAPESSNANVHGDPVQNPSSPYYLHANETLSLAPISKVLTRSNYQIWARSIRQALTSKNKFEFLDCTIPKPNEFHLSSTIFGVGEVQHYDPFLANALDFSNNCEKC